MHENPCDVDRSQGRWVLLARRSARNLVEQHHGGVHVALVVDVTKGELKPPVDDLAQRPLLSRARSARGARRMRSRVVVSPHKVSRSSSSRPASRQPQLVDAGSTIFSIASVEGATSAAHNGRFLL